ncbi:MAG: hypothetical protein KF708_12625 [Pirellulales bacterium]|nr:hypothetical protein [Pirellulales bacterium]
MRYPLPRRRGAQLWALVVACLVGSAGTVQAQDANPIDIRVKLREGERITLQIINERSQNLPGQAPSKTKSAAIASAQVQSISQTDMILRWARTGGRILEPNPPDLFAVRMLELEETSPLELELSAAGMVLGVRNWREVQAAMQTRVEQLINELVRGGAKPEVAGALGSRVKESISTEAGVDKLTADDAYIYFGLSGRTVQPGGTSEYAGELVSPFGGDRVPAPIVLTVKADDAAKGTITIRSEQKADEAEARRMMVEFFKRSAKEQGKPFDEAKLPKTVAIATVAEYLIELESGLPLKLVHGREVNVDGVVQVDTTAMQRVAKQL